MRIRFTKDAARRLISCLFYFCLPALLSTPGQAARPLAADTFITTWKTDNDGSSFPNQITIPTNGTGYNYQVNWEHTDDPEITGTLSATGSVTITFDIPGTYRVVISGAFPRIYFNDSGDKLKILSVEQWGTTKWTSMENAFKGAANLQINASDAPDLSIATNMGSMFQGAAVMNSPIGHWDVSNIRNMYHVFNGAKAFNQNINGWNVSKVTETYGMFQDASAFNQDLDGWEFLVLGTMSDMFRGAASFNGNIGTWNVSTVNNMNTLFQNAAAFNQDLDGWDVGNVKNMVALFNGATLFNGNISTWDVSKVTNMTTMFQNAKAFNQNLDDWEVGNVTSMGLMFNGASRFNGNIGGWDVFKVTNMNNMFLNATAFNQNLDSWQVDNVTNMYAMFQGAVSFNGSVGEWKVGNVTNMNGMFQNATVFNQDLSKWNVSKVTNMAGMFHNAIAFNGNISTWTTSEVVNMYTMFYNASAFNQDLSEWDVAKVENMAFMFHSATAFNQDIGRWDVAKVTQMDGMLQFTNSFDQNLGGWDITNVSSMSNMLSGSKLSTENYDHTLMGWAGLTNLKENVVLHAAGLVFCEGAAARDQLLNQYNWIIYFDRKDALCGINIMPSPGNVIYVDQNAATPDGNGNSWTNAARDLADALKWARVKWGPGAGWNAENPLKIYVAKGTYKPKYHAGESQSSAPDNRENAFVMVPFTHLYGGFDPANTITDLSHQRILPQSMPTGSGTILSGQVGVAADGSDNAYHVVISTGNEPNDSFLMDGFTIANGNADSDSYLHVNGKVIHHRWGAGWYNIDGSPGINHVHIINNFAGQGDDGLGGGMFNAAGSPNMRNMVFSGNTATHKGGGIFNHPVLTIQFRMANSMEDPPVPTPSLTNVIISGNQAPQGAGMYNLSSNPTLTNVTISGNSSSAIANEDASPVLHNSIVWGNAAGITDAGPGAATVSYSIVQGGYAGINVLNTDPRFVNAPAPAGAPFTNGNYLLLPNSPAINSGNPLTNTTRYAVQAGTTDLAGEERIQDEQVDLGVFEVACTSLTLAPDGTSVNRWLLEVHNYFFDACNLVAMVEPKGEVPLVSGEMNATTWTKDGIISFHKARYLRRHYDLAPVIEATNGTADVTLYYTQEDFNAYNAAYGTEENAGLPTGPLDNLPGNIRIAQFHGDYSLDGLTILHPGKPTYIVPKAVIWNETYSFWEVRFSVTGFSAFFLTGQNDAALPVNLVAFNSQKKENGVLLQWQTTREVNVSHFEVQRSTDGRTFEPLATVRASGGENQNGANYTFTDHPWISLPPNQPLGNVFYYRLKIVDLDATFAYSDIVSEKPDPAAARAMLYPNPVFNGTTSIAIPGGMKGTTVKVRNLLGKEENVRLEYTPEQEGLLYTGKLAPGIYIVTVEKENKHTILKLVVE